jgi:hypothetical protein
MKTLPGIKIIGFLTLVFIVAVAVYGQTRGEMASKKTHKYIVRFGWTDTNPSELDPVQKTLTDVQKKLDSYKTKPRYKLRHYAESTVDSNDVGDLDICFPDASRAITNSSAPQAAPSGTPKGGAKTQLTGYAQFEVLNDATAFSSWIDPIVR